MRAIDMGIVVVGCAGVFCGMLSQDGDLALLGFLTIFAGALSYLVEERSDG